MSRKYFYYLTLSNDYLGKVKEIKGASPYEVDLKATEQLRKWHEQEMRERERERIQDLKEQAAFDTERAQKRLSEYQNILNATLDVDDRLDWSSLEKHDAYPAFSFTQEKPEKQKVHQELGVPKEIKWLEFLLPFIKSSRLKKQGEADEMFTSRLEEYKTAYQSAEEKHEEKKKEYERELLENNQGVNQFRLDFESAIPEAVEKYVYMVLEHSQYPEGLELEYEVQFFPETNALVVNCELPGTDDLPCTVQYKFVASRKEVDEIQMKKKEYEAFYDTVIHQICLRTIHELFESVYIPACKVIVFNGWVHGIDRRTGNDFHSCILSCMAKREEFESLKLDRVDPKECFRKLKGISAGATLAELAPVQPLMDLNRDDTRFIESQEVLAKINSKTNLATMDWAEFEHLVRELFGLVFAGEGEEVKVTQSSRDGGVDAIAFDPDPIRGGKIVIQAKRYNNVVPIAAVRELNQVVTDEGAIKGILVSTSHFGSDSIAYAKDKPLKLINGNELVGLFQQYGYAVTIRTQSSRGV
ncbi:restriction system protein [Melghirimyces profundicolus]|uniref:Restriction system protein n=1 Tax=Melghirimyces profundicolus TaxID=1242148 RepID=A0A2T6BD64_9BACL|nr:restriction endonuclease [Melghirimyces profundicolus]PTX53969.1 restriction system protein [Melghirimyces profundicolus]